MLSRIFEIAVCICLGSFVWVGSVEAGLQDIPVSKRELIRQVLDLTFKGEDLQRAFDQELEQLREHIARMPADPGAPPQVQELWRKRMAEASARLSISGHEMMQEVLSSPEVTQAVESFYNENFSEEELKQIVNFCKSPAGRKWLGKSCELGTVLQPIVLRNTLPKIQEAIQSEVPAKPLDTESSHPPAGPVPAKVEIIIKKGDRYHLIVSDDTTTEQLRNLVLAISSNRPVLKQWGIELGVFATGLIYVFRERDRQFAQTEFVTIVLSHDTDLKRRYYRSIAACFQRFLEGGTIATIGYPAVDHEVLIKAGPGAEDTYQSQQKLLENQ